MTRLDVLTVLLAAGVTLAACTVPVQHGLDEAGANEVLTMLERSGVAARKTLNDGSDPPRFTVSVPQTDGPRALELLRAHGLPRAPQGGFTEIYGQPSLIPTPTEERARYLRALSGEIETTLTSVEGVVSARVHLVAEEREPLASTQDPPRVPARAAVLLKVQSDHHAIADAQVQALVAGSVPGLAEGAVTVVRTTATPFKSVDDLLVSVGPLRVTPSSRSALIAGLAAAIGLLALLATVLLLTARRLAALERETDAAAAGLQTESEALVGSSPASGKA